MTAGFSIEVLRINKRETDSIATTKKLLKIERMITANGYWIKSNREIY